MSLEMDKIRELTAQDLDKKEREVAESLFKLRVQITTKQSTSFAGIKHLRRDMARIKTARAEKEAERLK